MMHVARRHDVDEIGAFYAECFALDLSTRVVMALGRNGYRQFAAVAHDRERLPMLRGFGAKAVAEIDRVLAVYCPLPVPGQEEADRWAAFLARVPTRTEQALMTWDDQLTMFEQWHAALHRRAGVPPHTHPAQHIIIDQFQPDLARSPRSFGLGPEILT